MAFCYSYKFNLLRRSGDLVNLLVDLNIRYRGENAEIRLNLRSDRQFYLYIRELQFLRAASRFPALYFSDLAIKLDRLVKF